MAGDREAGRLTHAYACPRRHAPTTALLSPSPPKPTDDLAAAVAMLRWRLLPVLWAGYFEIYVVRNNIAFAKEASMGESFGLSEASFGLASGLYFLGYSVAQVPGTQAVARCGARRVLGTIVLLSSLVSSATGFVAADSTLRALRFLLGLCGAGYATGSIYYLARAFPERDVGSAVALLLSAGPVGYAVSSVSSDSIVALCDGLGGWAGWRWLFWTQAAPGILVGVLLIASLPDAPHLAAWLPAAQ